MREGKRERKIRKELLSGARFLRDRGLILRPVFIFFSLNTHTLSRAVTLKEEGREAGSQAEYRFYEPQVGRLRDTLTELNSCASTEYRDQAKDNVCTEKHWTLSPVATVAWKSIWLTKPHLEMDEYYCIRY